MLKFYIFLIYFGSILTQGGSGYARNIKFLNIVMQNVTNPIIIDQNYCDQERPCQEHVTNFSTSNTTKESNQFYPYSALNL